MEPLTRRQVLWMGALGGLGTVVGGVGMARHGTPWDSGLGSTDARSHIPPATLVEPEVLRSEAGRLQVELVAGRHRTTLAGREAHLMTYNGQVPGQTWRVRPGDRIDVRLENRLEVPTNLHTHGLHVSPQGNSDNPLLSLGPGETFDYSFELPRDHPAGVCWYHPHVHGRVADQVFAGLYGTIVVEDDDIPGVRERVLVISDTSLTSSGEVRGATQHERMMGREGDLVLVNGQLAPEIVTARGEHERWRIVNACTSRYVRLALTGQQMSLLGTDSGHESAARPVEDVLLAPGNRADLLVRMVADTGELRALAHDRGDRMMGMMSSSGRRQSEALTLATVRAEGARDGEVPAVRRPADSDLRLTRADGHRDISFTMAGGMGGMMSPGFDGRAFDAARTDQRVVTGSVEEWTLRNPTPVDHPFHLHVWPMQVIATNGAAVADTVWRDVVNVPAGGEVVVRIRFATFSGTTVYHCHILDHEDAGMMGIVAAAAAT